jgi:hypothetical protein
VSGVSESSLVFRTEHRRPVSPALRRATHPHQLSVDALQCVDHLEANIRQRLSVAARFQWSRTEIAAITKGVVRNSGR